MIVHCPQMENEVDLVLEKKDVLKRAVTDWEDKWVPAIAAYSDSCTGKVTREVVSLVKHLYSTEGTYKYLHGLSRVL